MKIAIGRKHNVLGGVRVMSATENNLTDIVATSDVRDQELGQIREALRGLRFGSVNVIVQDGVVVQIDRTEKRRIRRPESK
jgi:hypothetical protein